MEGKRSARDGSRDRDPSLEDYDHEDVAARLGRAVKTVARKLGVIRRVWREGEDQS
jgi:hypothetical protein